MSQNAKPRGQARAALLNEMHPSLIQIGAIYLRFADFQKLTLASSNRSALVESTTKMMPSVQRVYDLHSGLNLSLPPTSHMRNAVPLDFPPGHRICKKNLESLPVDVGKAQWANCPLFDS